MSSNLSSSSSLHSDDYQGSHETVASSPPKPPISLTSPGNRFHSLPSHRRANTEYIARPPIFEEDHIYDPTSIDGPSKRGFAPSAPSWTDTFPKKKLEARARVLSDWFQGRSDPVNLGIATRPNGHPDSDEMDKTRFSTVRSSHNRSNSSFTTFFGLRKQAEEKPLPPAPADDDILNIDIDAALSLPNADVNNEDAVEALREQASSVLREMQEAYRERTFAIHQVLAAKNEKQEELEETRARADHLRMQLDGMAAKVLDQEKAMKAMAEELEQEKRLRQQEESRNRSRTMRAIPPDEDIPSLVLQTPHRGGKRTSHGTLTSDSGFESGDESVADSVFSHKESIESPTSTLTAPSPNLSQVMLSTPTVTPATQKNLSHVTSTPGNTPTPTRSSAYDRVIKGFASTRLGSSFVGNTGNPNQCGNCHGVPASEAWSVMGILKDENRGLKTRLGELELVIDDCIGLVGP